MQVTKTKDDDNDFFTIWLGHLRKVVQYEKVHL